MRFIRTKDGIYNTRFVTPILIDGKYFIDDEEDPVLVIKQADTIEELCDKFVWVDYDYSRGFICNIEFVKNCTKSHEGRLYGDSKYIFGAIWTDKGLIYVAKMNEKGELELL